MLNIETLNNYQVFTKLEVPGTGMLLDEQTLILYDTEQKVYLFEIDDRELAFIQKEGIIAQLSETEE